MLKLLIQTVLNRVDLVLLADSVMLGVESWTSQKDEVKKLLPAIELLLNEYDYQWSEIEKVAVVVGKGNFSSTRIGVTIANTIALATGAKIYQMEIEEETSLNDILDRAEKLMAEGESVTIAQPIYRSEPMISPSKKKKFTE